MAQPPERRLAEITHDPFFGEEVQHGDGTLRIHYQSPLVVEEDVYVGIKSGSYTPCFDPEQQRPIPCGPEAYQSQVWSEAHYQWRAGRLEHRWTFESDWKPVPYLRSEQVFHAAVHRDILYVPGLGGTLHKVDRRTGKPKARINPFGRTVDPGIYLAGPPSIDDDGNVYYNALKQDLTNPFHSDAQGWLVKVSPSGATQVVSYGDLVPEAPAADDLCYTVFPSTGQPLPPPPNADGSPALPPQAPCLSQRPGLNVAPALAPDGTLYTVSRSHRNDRYGYLVAVGPDLRPKWSRSLRGLLDDGCGRLATCREGSTPGVEPATNLPPAGRVSDSSTSSPVVLPDGGILYGALTDYNGWRGHLFKFSASGDFLASYDFGWDITPAVYRHGKTYSILIKDNHYAPHPFDERFFITQLSPELRPEWKFKATYDQRCARDESGAVNCEPEPGGTFEWCINAPAVDREGTVHVASEDGYLYAIGQGGGSRGASSSSARCARGTRPWCSTPRDASTR